MSRNTDIYPSARQVCESFGRPNIAHFTEKRFEDTIETKEDPVVFAAVKLIEMLYKAGKLPDEVFGRILESYADRIDVSRFKRIPAEM